MARLVVDTEPRTVVAEINGHKATTESDDTVDLDQSARFSDLNAKYGRWGARCSRRSSDART